MSHDQDLIFISSQKFRGLGVFSVSVGFVWILWFGIFFKEKVGILPQILGTVYFHVVTLEK